MAEWKINGESVTRYNKLETTAPASILAGAVV
jgi:hypothetical protein